MAGLIGISRGYLSELENDRAEASDKVLRAMEVELGISPTYVRDGVEPMFPTGKKFQPSGKQIDISVGGDGKVNKFTNTSPPTHLSAVEGAGLAGGAPEGQRSGEKSGSRSFDAALMRMLIEVLLQQLGARQLQLSPAKFAELTVLIYDHLADQALNETEVARTAQRYIRLVA